VNFPGLMGVLRIVTILYAAVMDYSTLTLYYPCNRSRLIEYEKLHDLGAYAHLLEHIK